MPVLFREPELFPEGLFEDVKASAATERRWSVLHTRPRQEKSLARYLHQVGVPFYLPLIPRHWRSRGRVLTSYLPLFAGYVFLLADREDCVGTLSTRRVARSLAVADQERLWHDLEQINRLIASGAPILPEDRLVPGATVEIRSGALAGLRGKILRTASGRRFVVQVDFIQQGASVLLDGFALVKAEKDTAILLKADHAEEAES